MPHSIETALAIVVIAAAWSDLRTRRIPNWITVPGAAIGILLNTYAGGFHGALSGLAGCGLGLGIFLVLYLAAGMGAGDVKLFGAVGAFVGPQELITVFVFTALLGGIAALILVVSRGRLRETIERTGQALLGLAAFQFKEAPADNAGSDGLRLPYGVVIAAGTLLARISHQVS